MANYWNWLTGKRGYTVNGLEGFKPEDYETIKEYWGGADPTKMLNAEQQMLIKKGYSPLNKAKKIERFSQLVNELVDINEVAKKYSEQRTGVALRPDTIDFQNASYKISSEKAGSGAINKPDDWEDIRVPEGNDYKGYKVHGYETITYEHVDETYPYYDNVDSLTGDKTRYYIKSTGETFTFDEFIQDYDIKWYKENEFKWSAAGGVVGVIGIVSVLNWLSKKYNPKKNKVTNIVSNPMSAIADYYDANPNSVSGSISDPLSNMFTRVMTEMSGEDLTEFFGIANSNVGKTDKAKLYFDLFSRTGFAKPNEDYYDLLGIVNDSQFNDMVNNTSKRFGFSDVSMEELSSRNDYAKKLTPKMPKEMSNQFPDFDDIRRDFLKGGSNRY